MEGYSPIEYQANAVPWCHTANPLTSPFGGVVIEKVGLTTNFFPSITCQPDPDVRVKQFYTSQNGSDAQHTLRSAEIADVCPNDPNDDVDGDGICVGNGFNPPMTGDNDNCPTTPNPGQANADGDQWGDACDNCPATSTPWEVPPADGDCDKWTDADEALITTDAGDACGFTAGAPGQSETWPPDLVESNNINISDVLALKPVFGTTVGPTSPRFDIVPSGSINISDVLALKPVFGQSCTP